MKLKLITIPLLAIFLAGVAYAGLSRIMSGVYGLDETKTECTGIGKLQRHFRGSTEHFEFLEVYSHTLEPGIKLGAAYSHEDLEELIIVREGTVEQKLNGTVQTLPAGSVTLVLPGDSFGIGNAGEVPASYYVLRWRTRSGWTPVDPVGSSVAVSWDDMEVKQIAKGERRQIIQSPTSMLREFEMHTTQLKPGWKSHDQHTHVEDEIILVRYGEVEQLIDGEPHRAGPGAVIFLNADQPHGIRNAGEGPCEYYAFKWRLPGQA